MKMTEEPMRFKHITRLGNWYERQVLEEYKMKDYLQKKEQNKLVSIKEHELQHVNKGYLPLNNPPSEGILLGQHVLLQSCYNQGLLANDCSKSLDRQEKVYQLSATQEQQQCQRTVFQLMPAWQSKCRIGDPLTYGMRFSIQAHRLLSDQPLSLHSAHPNPHTQSQVSKKQQVSLTSHQNAENVWCFEHVDPALRFKLQNTPIEPEAEVLVKHVYTQQWLASDQFTFTGSFGQEWEVFCHSYFSKAKTQNLASEREGRTTIDEHLRCQGQQNTWKVITQDLPRLDNQPLQPHNQKDLPTLLSTLRHNLMLKGIFAFRQFRLQLIQMASQPLSAEQLKQLALGLDIALHIDEAKQLCEQITIDGLCAQLFHPLSPSRLQLVQQAYNKLSISSPPTLSHIAAVFNPNKHPQVLNNSMTSAQVFNQFMGLWNTNQKEHVITQQEFIQFYQDVSNAVTRDDHFQYLIKNAWGLTNC